ncbi:deoxyhypusine synthase [Candidatus Marsarchaeota archaeon]|nr:deoxyhypusine synthase [Candidatus Marsarchaeota archaeon]
MENGARREYIRYKELKEPIKSGRRKHFTRPLRAIEVKESRISDLLDAMAGTGFQGKKLGEAARIWCDMLGQKGLTIYLGYAGSMSTTGQWKIIKWLIENRYIDVLVSTGANISEDIFEAMGKTYYQGTHMANDEELLDMRIDRFYDVYADEFDYRDLENLIQEFGYTLDDKEIYSTREFLNLFGKFLDEKGIDSILAAAAKQDVPVYSPALLDSGYGVALSLLKRQGKFIRVDQTKDIEELATIAEKSDKTGVIYVGGGVPKDTIQLATVTKCLFKGGDEEIPHEYAIQLTTDSPQWGGLSGCTFEEAISWGKIKKQEAGGRYAVVYCDATIALPILVHALNERVKIRVDPPDQKWVFSHE